MCIRGSYTPVNKMSMGHFIHHFSLRPYLDCIMKFDTFAGNNASKKINTEEKIQKLFLVWQIMECNTRNFFHS